MTTGTRLNLMVTISVMIAGASIGSALSGLEPGDLPSIGLLIILAGVGEWLEVRIGPLGAFTLGPIVAFPALWLGGSEYLLIVGLLPAMLLEVAVRRRPFHATAATIGARSAALWVGYTVYFVTAGARILPASAGGLEDLTARSLGVAAFWVALLVVQGYVLNLSEGIRFRTASSHLLKSAWPHVVFLTAAAVALGYIQHSLGMVIMGFAVIMLIELYYPWRLLGEQAGALLTSLQMMAQAVDLKDPYTSNHSQRVAYYAVRVARVLGLPENDVERIRVGALMHDIGKIGISGRIIRKPGRLTLEEQALMREHASVSARIIEHLEILGQSAAMVRHHHENWNGTGYPDGLSSEGIPVGARVIFVADAFDALTTDRPYRKGASHQEALMEIRRNAGSQFDPRAVDALERVVSLL